MGKDVKVGLGLCLIIGLLLFLIYGVGRRPPQPEPVPAYTTQQWSQETPPVDTGRETRVDIILPGDQELALDSEGSPQHTDSPSTVGTPPEPDVTLEQEREVFPVTPPKPPARYYVVAKGDSLWKIAEMRYGDGKHWKHIQEANRDKVKDPTRLNPGDRLIIPALSLVAAEKQTPREERPAGADAAQVHTVAPGDTLSQIAKQRYGSERYWKHIWEANKKVISDPHRLPRGCKLLIPKLAEPAD